MIFVRQINIQAVLWTTGSRTSEFGEQVATGHSWMLNTDLNNFPPSSNPDTLKRYKVEYLRAEKTIFFWSFSKLVMMSLVEGPILIPASPVGHCLLRVPPIVATQFWHQFNVLAGHTQTNPNHIGQCIVALS